VLRRAARTTGSTAPWLLIVCAVLLPATSRADLRPLWMYSMHEPAPLEVGAKELGQPAFFAGGERLVAGDRQGRLVAFEVAGGAKLWSRMLGDAVVAPPVPVGTERLLVAGADGSIRVVDSASGADVWVDERPGQAGFHTRPLVHGPLVVAQDAANKVVGRSLNGSFVFSYEDVPPLDELALFGEATPATDGKRIFVGMSDGTVLALPPRGGKAIWGAVLPSERPRAADAQAGPLAIEGRVYVGSTQAGLVVLDAATGRTQANFELTGLVHLVAAGPDELYALAWDGTVVRLQISETGKPKALWSVKAPGVPARPTLMQSSLLYCNGNGIVELARGDGSVRSRRVFERGCSGGVGVATGLAAHMVHDGTLVVWKVLAPKDY
jgi:outer membrane protein assembly factor BamB